MLPIRADKSPNDPLLPMLDGDPNKRVWEPLVDQPATLPELKLWLRRDPFVGLGVIMGNGLVVMDVDDRLFCEFILRHLLPHLETWVNLTGRGFVHIFLRTRTPPRNGRLLHPEDGRKLADIRYTNAYVGAPPSPYSDHGETGFYAILQGGPEQIPIFDDADRVWDALVAEYCHGVAPRRAVVTPTGETTHDRSVQPPLGEDTPEHARLRLLLQNRSGSFDLRRRLERGYDLADFPGQSHSEVDWMTCKELIKSGWTDEEITWAYRTLPIGQDTYQNLHRPDHGDAYLTLTLQKAREAVVVDEEKLQTVVGQNFRISNAVKVRYPKDPEFVISFVFSGGRVGTVHLDWREMTNPRTFRNAVFRDTSVMPTLQPGHRNNDGFTSGFLVAFGEILQEVDPPPEATEPGQLERLIKRVVQRRLTRNAPPGNRYGWYAGDDVHIPQEMLQEQIDAEPRGRFVKPDQIWDVLRGGGGRRRQVTVDDATIRVWVVDADWLED